MPDHLTRPTYPDHPDRSGEELGYSLIQSIHNYCESPKNYDHSYDSLKEYEHRYDNLRSQEALAQDEAESSQVEVDHPLNLLSCEETTLVVDQPLSLVVRKESIDNNNNNSSSNQQQLKIREFAKQKIRENQQIQQEEGEGIQQAVKLLPNNSTEPTANGSAIAISVICNGGGELSCDFCDKKFTSRSHLNSHVVIHTGERAFSCPVCSKDFARKSTLRAHMTTHTKHSNFMCEVCEKACNDKNSLEEHKRMHTGEKPFVCSVCSKAYARKSHLNVHFRVHTGERPFACVHCEKDFTEKRFLNDHIQTAHTGKYGYGPLKCPNCSREFAYKTSLKQHLKKRMCERNRARQQLRQQAVNAGNATPQQQPHLVEENSTINSDVLQQQQGAVATACNGNSAVGGQQQVGGQQVAGKQFKCPFCEKSYSWKQTLKQHVSMYHRNKVNTDEFWKYELVKNRFSEIDASVKEVLWKKQLGRHLEEEGSAPSPFQPKDESIEMKASASVQESVGSLRSSINGSISQEIEEPMDYSETVENPTDGENNQNGDYNNSNDVLVAMRSSVQNFIIREPRELASSLPPVQIQIQPAKTQRQMSSSLPTNQIQMSSSLPTNKIQMSLSTQVDQHQQTTSISSAEAEEDTVAIDYSVRRSADVRRPSQNGQGSRSSHELIRMLVANRANIDSNNNNVPMVLETTYPISRGSSPAHTRGSSPAHTRGSSQAHTRGSSPSFNRGCSPSIARENSPSLNRGNLPSVTRVNSPALVRVSSPIIICNPDLQKPQQAQAFNNNNNIRAATPVDMSNHGNRTITGSPAGETGSTSSGDNSLLKALLMKNTDSSSSMLPGSGPVPAPFFQLPENKSNSNNILRNRLLGICDDTDDESTSTVSVNQTGSKDDHQNYTIADDATTEIVEDHHEYNNNNDDDVLKNDVKSKNLAEDDYKHRSVLKVLLYRYNTSHRL